MDSDPDNAHARCADCARHGYRTCGAPILVSHPLTQLIVGLEAQNPHAAYVNLKDTAEGVVRLALRRDSRGMLDESALFNLIGKEA